MGVNVPRSGLLFARMAGSYFALPWAAPWS